MPRKMKPSRDERESESLLDVISRSQRGFRELIDSFDRIAFHISLDGRIQVINREFAGILGLPFSAIVDHSVEEFVAEPQREEIQQALSEFLAKRSWRGVIRVRWKDKDEVRFYDCVVYAVVKAGQVTGASGLARDISAQRESESRFTDLFETMHEGVYFSMPDGRLLDANPAFVSMMGYDSKEELLAQSPADLYVDPEHGNSLLTEIERAGFLRDREIVMLRKDGTALRLLNSCVAIRDAAGRTVRIQGSLADITERRRMERQLREEQEFVRRLVTCFPDIIAVLDTAGGYSFVSPRIQEILGYSPEEYIGMSLEQRPHPEDRGTVLKFFNELITGKTGFGTVEYRTRHKDGSWRTIRANASPLTDADDKIFGVVASARDVTESKRLEQQLLQSEKLAAIGQMVSGVAHELNNPLTAILGVSDLLRERAAADDSRRQIELIQKQARRAAELVQGLLMFSRPSPPKSQQVRLADLIRRAVDLRRDSLARQNITVEFNDPVETARVDADPNQLVQVFVNLLNNSEQAIAEARGSGIIRIRMALAGDKLEILFDDDGPGISEENRTKIFDPFFTTRRATGGSGLGLTIAIVLIREHGGSIEASSSPDGGARLRILLPVSKSSPILSGGAQPGALKNGLQGRCVLIVEDEEVVRDLLSEGLASRGVKVDAVCSGEEGWECLSRHTYDAVLCDMNLQGLSGMELFQRVRANLRTNHTAREAEDGGTAAKESPRFLFITGEVLAPDRLSEIEKSGARALQKPFQISELAAVLLDYLDETTPALK